MDIPHPWKHWNRCNQCILKYKGEQQNVSEYGLSNEEIKVAMLDCWLGRFLFWSPRGGGGGRGTRDFEWRGWSNGAKSQDPKKSLGLPAKLQKIPGPKINPKKIPCRFCGNSSDGKANWLNWSGWSLVHGRAPRDNADYCITRKAM